MPLTCQASEILYEDFEFLDCATISISYNQRGIAAVSFTVVSTSKTLLNSYNDLTFGGVSFKLSLRDITVAVIPGTLVYLFQMSMMGFGC